MKYFSNFEHSLYNKESMDIIQVIIFIIIIVAAIVQQISKTGKEKKTPSPKKVLADIFPEIEQENIEISKVKTLSELFMYETRPVLELSEFSARGIEYLLEIKN